MSQTIELESIRRPDIKPGEILVARVPRDTPASRVQEMADTLRSRLPAGVEALVITDDVDLQTLCLSDPA